MDLYRAGWTGNLDGDRQFLFPGQCFPSTIWAIRGSAPGRIFFCYLQQASDLLLLYQFIAPYQIRQQNKAFVMIDIQNDITKNDREIIGNSNTAVDWAVSQNMHVVYIKHNNLSVGTRKPM